LKVVKIKEALKGLKEINEEIRYKSCVEEKTFSAGLIAFRPKKKRDSKQIRQGRRLPRPARHGPASRQWPTDRPPAGNRLPHPQGNPARLRGAENRTDPVLFIDHHETVSSEAW
jgi:hypothetical protein